METFKTEPSLLVEQARIAYPRSPRAAVPLNGLMDAFDFVSRIPLIFKIFQKYQGLW